MLVCVSNWAWLPLSEYPKDKLPLLKQSLTVQPRRTSQHQGDIPPIHLFSEKDGWIGIPRSYFLENQKLAHDIKIEMAPGREIELPFVGELKGDQVDAVDKIVQEANADIPGGILQATPGWGKTVAALAIWLRLRTTGIVVVQREYLLNQWRLRILGDKNRKIQGFVPDARVGIIQGDRCEYGDDYDISLATIQTLASRRDEFPDDFWSAFGLVASDETHRLGAPSWAEVIPMFKGRYRLGLTATPRRKDGADKVFFWHIGPITFKSNVKRVIPRLRRVYTGFKLVRTPSFDPNLASKEVQLRQICANPVRNRKIVDELLRAVKTGRKVLVLSERRKHLERLRDMFGKQKPQGCTVDFYVGGREQSELDIAEKADVVFACVTDDVECLTLGGWRNVDDLSVGEPIASYSMDKGLIEYQALQKKCVYDFDGELCHLNNKTLDVMMTWNHRNVVLSEKVVGGVSRQFEQIKPAEDLVARDKLRLIAPFDYPEQQGIGEPLAELVGWVIAEGTYKSNNGRGIVVYQNAGKNADRIEALLSSSSLAYRRSEYRPGCVSWHIPEESAVKIKQLAPKKMLTQYLVSLPQPECKALFNGLVDGDGHRRPDGRITFIQKEKATIDWFCVLAMRLGYRFVVGCCGGTYRVHLTRKTHIGLNDGRSKIIPVEYKGRVWCPVVENGTWVARSNGSVFITGNTYQMAKEALDIPSLDTLFLTTPVSDVEQAVGRIMREFAEKKDPVVTDFIDRDIDRCMKLWNSRRRFYIQQGMYKETG